MTRRMVIVGTVWGGSVLLNACGAPAPVPGPASAPRAGGEVRVAGFALHEGLAARAVADARCGARGVRATIYDRFDRATGEWVYGGGCA